MHELAITESVVESVAERVGDARVTRVVLEIGMLSGVLPDALRFCFDLCTEATVLQGAALEIIQIPGRGHCQDCNTQVALEGPVALCPRC
jgi:hydrogenase nickel incorporation protein HypA/HybF